MNDTKTILTASYGGNTYEIFCNGKRFGLSVIKSGDNYGENLGNYENLKIALAKMSGYILKIEENN